MLRATRAANPSQRHDYPGKHRQQYPTHCAGILPTHPHHNRMLTANGAARISAQHIEAAGLTVPRAVLANMVFCGPSGKNCLDPQAHADYGQHDRYTDSPFKGVVTEHGYDNRGNNKDVGHDSCRAPCEAVLLHPDLPMAGLAGFRA
jgi:hypothetical protein